MYINSTQVCTLFSVGMVSDKKHLLVKKLAHNYIIKQFISICGKNTSISLRLLFKDYLYKLDESFFSLK